MPAKPEPDRAQAVDGGLADDREPVQRSVIPQGDARDGDHQEWDRHESPQDLVGQELQRVEAEPPRVEQLARHRDPPQAAGHDPHLAAVLEARRLVDRLERNGFVDRARDDVDKRRVTVVLRQDRLAEAQPLFADLARRLKRVYDGYSDDDLAVVLRFMEESTAAQHAATEKLTQAQDR